MTGQLNDIWVAYLQGQGYTGKQYNDLVRQALQDQTSSARKQVDDLWKTYLEGEGFSGSVQDMMYAWLGDKGYTGSLNDRWKQAIENDDVFGGNDPITCAYPLDASEAQLLAAGFSAKLVPSEDDTKGSYTILDGDTPTPPSATNLEGMVSEATALGGSVDFSSGKLGQEFVFTIPQFTPDAAVSNPIIVISGGCFSGGTYSWNVGAALNQDSTVYLIVSSKQAGAPVSQYAEPLVGASETFTVGVLLDNDAGVIRVWVDGDELTLLDDTIPEGTSSQIPFICAQRAERDDNGAAGAVCSVQRVTNAADFTTPFPTGTIDPCGNAI